MKERYDAVVIGSGFGGAITAGRLAQAGMSVAILERGRRWNKHDFPRTTGQTARSFWQDGVSSGLVEYQAFKKIDVIRGAGVGGGSLLYFNVHLRAPEQIFAGPRWPELISRHTLDPYYDLVQNMLESRPLAPPPGRALPARTTAFVDTARRAGYQPELVDVALHTGPQRANPRTGALQDGCVYCGNCMLGCHVHAKNSLDITYIGAAEERHGAEVFPLHVAECIEPAARGYEVHFRRVPSRHHGPATELLGSVLGDRVIVAAGTLGSTELLLRCRDYYRTLPALGPALGQGFSSNGDFLIPGTSRMDRLVDPGHGPSITAAFTHADGDQIITVEDLGLPDPFFWFLEGALPPARSRFAGLARLATAYLLRSLGVSAGKSRVEREIDALVGDGRTARFLPYLGMGTDAGDGRMHLRGGELDIAWSHRNSRALFRQMEAMMRRLSAAAGGRYVPSPLWRWPFRKLLTAHPLGGCAMGDHPDTSVVDHRGEVWGYPGLYVTDGAAICSALAVNPSLTIGALAERAAFWMLHDRDMSADDHHRPADLRCPPTGHPDRARGAP